MRPTRTDFKRAADIFKVLSHPDRLRIICSMIDGRTTTQKALIDETGWPQSTVNRHLSALRESGLVVAERSGTSVNLRLEGPVTGDLMQAVCEWTHPETGERMSGQLGGILAATGAPDRQTKTRLKR